MQSLDNDRDLANKIVLQTGVHDALEGKQIDFSQDIDEFSNDPVVQELFDVLNDDNYFRGVGYLLSAKEAQSHLKAMLMKWNIDTFSLSSDLDNGFPIGIIGSGGTYRAGPVIHNLIGDIDGNGMKEIITTALAIGPLYAINYDGTLQNIFGNASGAAYPALGKLSPSSTGLDVVFGIFGGEINAYDGTGSIISGWPREADNYITSPPVTADVNNDGLDEIFINEEDGCLHAYKADGTLLPGWPYCVPINQLWSQSFNTPAIGDIDDDGELEIVAVNGGRVLYAVNVDGTLIDGFPQQFTGNVHGFAVIGDVDCDEEYEIVVGVFMDSTGNDEAILIYSASGNIKHKIPIRYHRVAYGTSPVLSDIDEDGCPEILYKTGGYLFVFKYQNNAFVTLDGTRELTADWQVDASGDYTVVIDKTEIFVKL